MPISRKLVYKFQPKDKNAPVFLSKKITLPNTFSLRPTMAPILNQENLGDCVSNAYALTISTMTTGKGKTLINMSRLMNYALARCNTGGSVTNDSGIYVSDAANTIAQYGICPETIWPYNSSYFATFPTLYAFSNSKLFTNFTCTNVLPDLSHLQTCLVTNNVPIIFGFMVYSSFMSNSVAANGIVPMPNTKTETLDGGHCTCIVGYDNTKQWFICSNSLGTSWGDKGYFYMPYAYITNPNLASDFCYLDF